MTWCDDNRYVLHINSKVKQTPSQFSRQAIAFALSKLHEGGYRVSQNRLHSSRETRVERRSRPALKETTSSLDGRESNRIQLHVILERQIWKQDLISAFVEFYYDELPCTQYCVLCQLLSQLLSIVVIILLCVVGEKVYKTQVFHKTINTVDKSLTPELTSFFKYIRVSYHV